MYYWKTELNLSDYELNCMQQLQVKRLYVRLFDVEIQNGMPRPRAVLMIKNANVPAQIEVVPVIYMLNDVFKNLDHTVMQDMAHSLLAKAKIMTGQMNSTSKELQIDCDWTEKTRVNYFKFLDLVQAQLGQENITLTATIRLHQVKYRLKTGVPPIKRGMLMAYNLTPVKNFKAQNSILTIDELNTYITNLGDYPLELDVVLPAFNWKVWFRDGKFMAIVNNVDIDPLVQNAVVQQAGEHRFTFLKDTVLTQKYFRKNDQLRAEEITVQNLISSSKAIQNKLKKPAPHVALYHLDETNLKKYEKTDLQHYYQLFD